MSVFVIAGMGLLIVGSSALADPDGKQDNVRDKSEKKLREIRVAVFDLDVLKGVEEDPKALTDQIAVLLDALPTVTLVNRDQIEKVAEEQKIALTGLVDSASAVKLGKFLSAQYILVGRAAKIGHTYYLTLRVIDVETTVQATVPVKASVEEGFESVLARLDGPLTKTIQDLQQPVRKERNHALALLRKAAEPLKGKTVIVEITETHVNRPLPDPAAQMAAVNHLKSLGMNVIVLKDPKTGWKESLFNRGKYVDDRIDYLIEGEGISAYAATFNELISCRARVELRMIPLPGRKIAVSDKGVASRVDLVESLAAKAALEDAAVDAIDAMIMLLAEEKSEE
jgi:hypothetical protein